MAAAGMAGRLVPPVPPARLLGRLETRSIQSRLGPPAYQGDAWLSGAQVRSSHPTQVDTADKELHFCGRPSLFHPARSCLVENRAFRLCLLFNSDPSPVFRGKVYSHIIQLPHCRLYPRAAVGKLLSTQTPP